MLLNEEENVWKRRFDKERGLRKEAERLLEVKSRELYELNLALEDKIQAATEELRQSNEELSSMVDYTNGQKDVLLYQHEEIKKSIDVAFAIQSSFLPSEQEILLCTNHYFILNMPRDIVSGDFYWIHRKERRSIFIVADCTGHGVPGAFMSLIGNALLNKIILDNNVFLPDHILCLTFLGKAVKKYKKEWTFQFVCTIMIPKSCDFQVLWLLYTIQKMNKLSDYKAIEKALVEIVYPMRQNKLLHHKKLL
jgi:hypothetical protein